MSNDDILRQLYEKLANETHKTFKSQKTKTILLPLLKANSNNVFDILSKSAVEERILSEDFRSWALKNRFLRRIDETVGQKNELVLTIQGIWYYETKIGKISLETLLDSLQEIKFQFAKSSEPLNDKEKISLIFLIAFRVFSKDVAINTSTKRKCDYYQEAIEEIDSYCMKHGITKKGFFNPANFGLEHPISYVMRRLNDLPKKTNNIFCSTGEKIYFLEIDGEEKASERKLIYLWKKILPIGSSTEDVFDVFSFLSELSKRLMVSVCDNYDFYVSNWDSITDNCKYTLFD